MKTYQGEIIIDDETNKIAIQVMMSGPYLNHLETYPLTQEQMMEVKYANVVGEDVTVTIDEDVATLVTVLEINTTDLQFIVQCAYDAQELGISFSAFWESNINTYIQGFKQE